MPVVIILITGLLEGSPKEPIGLYHPSAGLLHLAQTTDGVKVRVENTKQELTDDILRGRVVAGIVQLPAPGNAVKADFLVESATTDAVQARTDAVALMDLMAAEGSHTSFTDATLKVTPVEAPLSPFWYVAPANLVLFMGIAVLVLAAGMFETRRLGVLQRLSAAPVKKRSIVFGQMASMMVTAVSMAIGLIFVGYVLFRVHWGNPLSVFLVILFLGISVGGAVGDHRDVGTLTRAGHRHGRDRRHHRRDVGRLRLPVERGEHDGEERGAHCATGVGHGRVRGSHFGPRFIWRDVARHRRVGGVRGGPERVGGLVLPRRVFSTT